MSITHIKMFQVNGTSKIIKHFQQFTKAYLESNKQFENITINSHNFEEITGIFKNYL